MLPTCTRHLAMENGGDAWLLRDAGKSDNKMQSRDLKAEPANNSGDDDDFVKPA
nr:hypothetical protein Iba_chr07bCG6610 [Ipomoea batatas]